MTDLSVVLGALLIMVGIIILVVDVAHPGLFLLIPAAVTTAIGIMLLAVPDFFSTNPLAAALVLLAVGAVGAVVAIPIYQRIAPLHPPIPSTVDTLRGMNARVTVRTEPGSMKGKVRVRGEIWSATSDHNIPEETDVTIVGGDGIVLKVAPIPPKESEKV